MNNDWFGLLNVRKPADVTSRYVVNGVQRMLRGTKVGHAGTLDPLATGVLVLGIGPATRLVEYVQRMCKQYTGTFVLGCSSDTEDRQGNVVPVENAPTPTSAQIEAALPDFIGQIQQRPPAFSALKVQGKRAYDLARQGKSVSLEPRTIEIYDIELKRYEYPELQLDIHCGSGTYIRSLGRDLARALGTEAIMSALVRIAIGPFRVEDAVVPDQLSIETILDHLIPPVAALADLPQVSLTGEETMRLLQGLSIDNRWQIPGDEIAGLNESGRLVSILAPVDVHRLRPLRNFSPPA